MDQPSLHVEKSRWLRTKIKLQHKIFAQLLLSLHTILLQIVKNRLRIGKEIISSG